MPRRTKRSDGLLQKSFRVKIKGISKKFIVYGHSEKELSEKEHLKRKEISRKLYLVDDPTVEEYYERWLKGRWGTVSESTIRGQDKSFQAIKRVKNSHFSNLRFGDIKMKEVTIDDLRTVQSELRNGRKSRTVNDYMAFLKHLFNDAYKERVIDYNPCILLKNLRETEERARDTCHRALSFEEQRDFFSCERCKSSYYYNVFRFAICTGMRAGEIGALRYNDIRDNTIHVERTITRTASGGHLVGTDAKTAAGRRIIPVTEQIEEILADQRELNYLISGGVTCINDYIFKAVEGGLLLATPVDREIRRICKVARIQPFTMHAFRSTFATRAIESGMNPKTLQEILGHSDFSITMSLYGHCLPSTKRKEMSNLNIVL